MWGRLLDSFLRRFVATGTLVVELPDGRRQRHGDGGAPEITVRLADPARLRRLVLNPDLALGEGYMDGDITIEGDDLHGLLRLLLENLNGGGEMVWWRRPAEALDQALDGLRQLNPVGRSRANVAHHYDLSDGLYELFLDADRQYSCGYFRLPSDTLEQAQAQKKEHIANKLLIEPGMRVLDIGCGWGGLAISMAREHGARVTGITLSSEQHRVATERVARAGLSGQVEIRLVDYREVEGQYDRIVSVGMFEHVGRPNYGTYFARVRDLLTPDGIALIHSIGRAAAPSVTSPFIRRHIFPGGYVPSLSEMTRAVEQTDLWITDVEVWRLHYAETLHRWEQRVSENADRVRALYDERFLRMWRYYLIASEMSFRAGRQCVFQMQLARHVATVPLRRDYLYLPETALDLPPAEAARRRVLAAAE